jgi:hypothetical protein
MLYRIIARRIEDYITLMCVITVVSNVTALSTEYVIGV